MFAKLRDYFGREDAPRPHEWFILLAAGALVVRYRWIFDDAFIYFRYVDNLLFLNLGLVYNPGEFVEGFSSPFWVLLLALLRLLRIPWEGLVLLVGLATLIAVWWMLVLLNRHLAPPGARFNFPMVFLLANYAVLSYFTSGVDTPLVLLAGVGFALFIVRPAALPLQCLVALSPLIRHELVIPYAICLLWAWRVEGRFPSRLFAIGSGSLGAWIIFRVYYYADLLPNTFYLKNDNNFGQGLRYVHDTMIAYHGYIIFALLAVLALLLARRGVPIGWSQRGLMLLAATPVLLYVIKIGGDARHFRYLVFPYCLAACAFAGVPEWAWRSFRLRSPERLLPAAAMLLALVTFIAYPRQLDRHPLRGAKHTMIDRIADADLHRSRLIPKFEGWAARVTPRILLDFRATPEAAAPWPPSANSFCLENYIAYNKHVLHTFGLTDAILARTLMPSERPGHKDGLKAMGRVIFRMQRLFGTGPGMYRKAVEAGRAPEWVADNLDSISVIQRKVFNRHHLLDNIRLAFIFPPRLRVVVTNLHDVRRLSPVR